MVCGVLFLLVMHVQLPVAHVQKMMPVAYVKVTDLPVQIVRGPTWFRQGLQSGTGHAEDWLPR